jgi:hypothetical protein
VEPPGGSATLGAIVVLLITGPLIFASALYALAGVVLAAGFILWWVHLSRREARELAAFPCPVCGEPGLAEKAVGIC